MGATVKTKETVVPTEPERVLQWRLNQFLRFGVSMSVAEVLAASRVDVREYEQFLERGCDHVTTARILL